MLSRTLAVLVLPGLLLLVSILLLFPQATLANTPLQHGLSRHRHALRASSASAPASDTNAFCPGYRAPPPTSHACSPLSIPLTCSLGLANASFPTGVLSAGMHPKPLQAPYQNPNLSTSELDCGKNLQLIQKIIQEDVGTWQCFDVANGAKVEIDDAELGCGKDGDGIIQSQTSDAAALSLMRRFWSRQDNSATGTTGTTAPPTTGTGSTAGTGTTTAPPATGPGTGQGQCKATLRISPVIKTCRIWNYFPYWFNNTGWNATDGAWTFAKEDQTCYVSGA